MLEFSPRKLLAAIVAIGVAGSFVVAGAPVGQELAGTQEGDEIATQDTTYLRVAHASPDAPAVDVYVEGDPVLENVSFGAVSEYMQLEAGTYNVTITAAGNESAAVFDGTVDLPPRGALTLAATGELTNETNASTFQPVLYTDDALEPGEDEAAVRIVHLVPDAPTVDVTVTRDDNTTVVADNVSYRNASEYVTVPAGTHTFEIREATAANDGTIVETVTVTLEGGTAYSALAVGYLDFGEAEPGRMFQVVLTRDATTTITLPAEETPTATGTATGTPTATATPTRTAEATPTGTATASPTAAGTATTTATPTPAGTPTPTGAATATPTPSETATPTGTPTPGGMEPTPTPTATDTDY